MTEIVLVEIRRETAAELHEGNERFQALVDLIPQLVWTITPDDYHDYFQQRWHDYTGMPRKAVRGGSERTTCTPTTTSAPWKSGSISGP